MSTAKVATASTTLKRKTAQDAAPVAETAEELIDLFVDAPLSEEEDEEGSDNSSSSADEEEQDGGVEENGERETDEVEKESDDEDEDGESDDSSEYSDLGEEDSSNEEESETEDGTAEEKPEKGLSKKRSSEKTAADISPASPVAGPSKPAAETDVHAVRADPAEYDIDSSDEEDLRNTIGNVPMEWYNDYPHLGYDWEGKKILKPAKGDELDRFLKRMDDPEFWKTVHDKSTGQDVVLSNEDVDLIMRLQQGKLTGQGDPYEPYEDVFSGEVMKTSLVTRPPHKRSFIPSLLEKEKVGKLVHAIKMGWIKPWKPQTDSTEEPEPQFYALWEKEKTEDPQSKSARARERNATKAPKMKLPGHAESYNPPPEYLLTDEEKKKRLEQDPEDRTLDFVPRSYPSMRLTPSWMPLARERLDRCLDLYLCPRKTVLKVHVNPEDLIPKLPKPKDLMPFPTVQAIIYRGHTGIVRGISVHPDGQFFASGGDDSTIRIWEVSTGRCFKTFTAPDKVVSVAWCPKADVCLLAAACGNDLLFFNPEIGDKLVCSNTDRLLGELDLSVAPTGGIASFLDVNDAERAVGLRLKLRHTKKVTSISWHGKGDYFSTVAGDSGGQVVLHQLSRLRSQTPFKKLTLVQKALFHPLKPFFFVCTQRSVRIYDLSKNLLKKVLQPSCSTVSSIAIHPKGDNVLVGSYDSRLCWFDLDSSVKPYQTLRHHNNGVRQVVFHNRYPLFASCSDDGSVIISHGMVYNDLNEFPLIVPVKQLKGHIKDGESGLAVLDCQFHPHQPWIFSAGADKTIRLFV
ncbi:Ribosome biogenesis protein BOP1 [Hypsibius exemplaris]|uniref:Ribosome biogenesis protein BOP1 homolog n=1 Tax=Hypsibius exemplaris TaxID=2072580 RepID=A0A1W0XAP7_HYPEX|nr:Ribosome biogenesis protein BOP1 [Hypsibius exemplaris]